MSTREITTPEEYSDLPKSWVWSTLGDICEKPQYGWTTKANHEAGRLKLLRTTDITSGSVDWSSVPFCSKEPEEIEKYLVHSDDIFISRAGSVGISFLINKPEYAVFASYLIRFRPKPVVDTKYFYFYLKSSAYWEAIGTSKSGIAVPNVNASKLARVPIPLAPLEQQHHIVAEIEKQFSRLEEAVANLRRIKANLKRYKAAVLKAAVEGKFTEQWRKDHPDVEPADKLLERILAERRATWKGKGTYEEPGTPNIAHVPVVPKEWVWTSLQQLTSAVRVICYGILMPKEHIPDGIPYVKVKDFKDDRIDVDSLQRTSPEIAASYERASLKPGDLLLAIRGTYGRVAEVPYRLEGGNITQDTARLDVTPLVNHRYIALHLRSEVSQAFFKRVARGVAVKGVNIGDIRLTPIALPPVGEQSEIVTEVERRLSVIAELDGTVEANLKRSDRLRQSILQQAFTGHIPYCK